MSVVRLYTICSHKAPHKGKGKFIYILETETSKGMATLTKTEHFEDKTAHEAYIFGLTEALKHINKHCTLEIFIESDFIYTALTKWLPGWLKNGFKKSSGEEVANANYWIELYNQVQRHNTTYWNPKTQHEYKRWLETEAGRG